MLSEWWNLSSPEAPELYCCYHTHTHTKVKRTLSKLRHTQTILLHELILYISWYVWYCGVHVVSCYDAVLGGGGRGIFGLLGGTEEVQYQCDCRLLSLSFTSLCFCGGRRSLCYSVSSGSWLRSWKTKCRFVGTDHKHIPDSSLSVLSFESRFFLVATIRHVSSSCWLTCIYKVHICVHMCNTRYLSNLLLWLLLMMILVPSWRFQPVLFLLVLISCWWLVLRSLKREEGDSCDCSQSVSFQGFVDILMKPFFFITLTVMLWRWSWLSVSLLLFFLSGPVVKLVWKLNKAIHRLTVALLRTHPKGTVTGPAVSPFPAFMLS